MNTQNILIVLSILFAIYMFYKTFENFTDTENKDTKELIRSSINSRALDYIFGRNKGIRPN